MERLHGVFTALVTPFDGADALDEPALRRMVRAQVEAGVAGLVPAGTTGESPTLAPGEYERLVEIVAEEAAAAPAGRRPLVFAGAGGNHTARVCELARTARRAGADGLLVVTPYYNKPTQGGLLAHFRAVASAGELPALLYNVPGRTGVMLQPETVLALAADAAFVGVKEASGRLDAAACILAERPPGFAVLSGDDALTLPMMALGADGVVSVVANAAPSAMVALVAAAAAGQRAAAIALQRRLQPLMTAAFLESNPIPIKAALARLGLLENRLRLPLEPASPATEAALTVALAEAGVLRPAASAA